MTAGGAGGKHMSNTSITGECFLTLARQFYDLQRQIYGSTDDWDEDDNYSDVLDCLYTYGWKFYDRLNLLYIISVIKHQQIKFDGEPDFILEKESGDPVSNMQTFCHSDIKLKLLYGICTAYGWDCLIPDTDDFWKCIDVLTHAQLLSKSSESILLQCSTEAETLAKDIKKHGTKPAFKEYLQSHNVDARIADCNLFHVLTRLQMSYPIDTFTIFRTRKFCPENQIPDFADLNLYDGFIEIPTEITISDCGNYIYLVIAGIEIVNDYTIIPNSLKYFLNCSALKFFANNNSLG